MNITEMTVDHVPQIGALEQQCFSSPWSERSIRTELNNDLSLWLVAMDGNTVAGYVGSQTVLGEADMMNLAVAPAYRRRGIGVALVTALLDRLKENGACSLMLEVRASNFPAQKLYEKLGFVVVGKRPRYYEKPREDALILKKEWKV